MYDDLDSVNEYLQSSKWQFGGMWFSAAMVMEFVYCWGVPPVWGWVMAAMFGLGFTSFAGFFGAALVVAEVINSYRCEEEPEPEPIRRDLPTGKPVRETSQAMSFVAPAAPIIRNTGVNEIAGAFAEDIEAERLDLDGLLTYIGNKITDEEKSLFQRKDGITTSQKFYADMNFVEIGLYNGRFRTWMIENGYFTLESNGSVSPTDKLFNLAADYVTN